MTRRIGDVAAIRIAFAREGCFGVRRLDAAFGFTVLTR